MSPCQMVYKRNTESDQVIGHFAPGVHDSGPLYVRMLSFDLVD